MNQNLIKICKIDDEIFKNWELRYIDIPNDGKFKKLIEKKINNNRPSFRHSSYTFSYSELLINQRGRTEVEPRIISNIFDFISPPSSSPLLPNVSLLDKKLCFVRNNKIIFKDANMNYGFGINKNKYSGYSFNQSTEDFISNLCYAKLKDYNQSAKMFGWGSIKKEMFESNKQFNINKIKLEYTSPKTNTVINYIELYAPNGKKLKFLLDDVEIITPDFKKLTKGYNEPLIRTKQPNAKVKVIKKSRLPYGTIATIKNTIKQGNVKYFKIITDDKKEHLIESKKIKVIA